MSFVRRTMRRRTYKTIIPLSGGYKKVAPSASDILHKEYGASKNFMTPNVIKRGKIAPLIAYELSRGSGFEIAYELSRGSGFEEGSQMYGVSVAEMNEKGQTRRLYNSSKSFSSRNDAEAYIKGLKERYLVSTKEHGSGSEFHDKRENIE